VWDWEADSDGPLTGLDVDLILAALDQHNSQCVKDAGRKLRRYLTSGVGPVTA
jgi:hypothetical protein